MFFVHPRPNFLSSVPTFIHTSFFPFPPPVPSSSLIFPLFPFLLPLVLLVYFILLHFPYVSPRYQYYKLIISCLFPFIIYCHFFIYFSFHLTSVKFSSHLLSYPGEGNGNPLQYPCLENPMDRGAW